MRLARPLISMAQSGRRLQTWAGTHAAVPAAFYEPASLEELQSIVRGYVPGSGGIRVMGAGHSPNSCAMNGGGTMISLRRYRAVEVDPRNRSVRAQGGALVSEINDALAANGLALDNLGSISEQTVAGLLSTGTHGSGLGKRILGCCVTELTLLLGSGKTTVCSRKAQPDLFLAASCSFGALGIIVEVVMDAVPSFYIRAEERSLRLTQVSFAPAAIVAAACGSEYYRLWWFPHTDGVLEWRARKEAPPQLAVTLGGVDSSSTCSSTSGQHLQCSHGGVGWLGRAGRTARALFDSLFGFHLLQAALFFSLWLPALVPLINRVWFAVQYEGPLRVTSGPSVSQLNFDCRFKQDVNEWAIPIDRLEEVGGEQVEAGSRERKGFGLVVGRVITLFHCFIFLFRLFSPRRPCIICASCWEATAPTAALSPISPWRSASLPRTTFGFPPQAASCRCCLPRTPVGRLRRHPNPHHPRFFLLLLLLFLLAPSPPRTLLHHPLTTPACPSLLTSASSCTARTAWKRPARRPTLPPSTPSWLAWAAVPTGPRSFTSGGTPTFARSTLPAGTPSRTCAGSWTPAACG